MGRKIVRRHHRSPKAVVKEKPPPILPRSKIDLINTVRQFLALKQQQKFTSERISDLSRDLKAFVAKSGHPDGSDKGHLVFELPEEIAGIKILKNEKHTTQRFLEDKAEEILKKKGLLQKCTRKIEVLDEDEILKAHYDGKLTEEDIDAMFEETVEWHLKPGG